MDKPTHSTVGFQFWSILITTHIFSLQPSAYIGGWLSFELEWVFAFFFPSLCGRVYWLQHVGTMHRSKMWGMHVWRMHTYARTHIHALICTFQLLQSSFPRCHTHFHVISLYTHSTGALNLWRWRLLGGFGLQILSEDSSNNCRGADMDTHTLGCIH